MNTGLWKMDSGLSPSPSPGMTVRRGQAGVSGDSRALADMPTSPSRRAATGPSLSALKGGEGNLHNGARADRNRTLPVPEERGRATTEAAMDDGRRIVESPSRARQASKPGIVRYVLAISLALVVIGFAVAYMTSV